MVATYFDKGKGRTGPVEYVLDAQRVQSGEATLLRGNAQITKDLIKTNNNELKYRSGVLSFTEQDIPEAQKQAIMDDFEKSTFAGMEKDQYNILWVQHKDKDKLELHFVIPRLELNTGKAFNPHWHKADQDRLLLFQDIQNAKYNLTNPYEAERANVLQMPTKWDNRAKTKEQINDVIIQGVSTGQLQSREQIIEFLENNDLEVKRSNKGKLSKNFIAVREKGTEDYIRLKGAYYNESFTSTAEVGKQLTKREREHSFTTPEQLREAEQRLETAISKRAEYNSSRYQAREQKQDINQSIHINNEPSLDNRDNERSISPSPSISHEPERELNRTNSRTKQVEHTKEPEIRTEREQVYQEPERTTEQRQDNIIHQTGELEDDKDRARINARNTATKEHSERIRAYEEQREAHAEARKTRGELFKSIAEQSIKLRKVAEQKRESVRNETPRDYPELYAKAGRAMQERANERGLRERYREAIEYVGEKLQVLSSKLGELINKVEQHIERKQEQPTQREHSLELIKAAQRQIKAEIQRPAKQERSQSRGYKMSM